MVTYFLSHLFDIHAANSAVCFLCRQPSSETINFVTVLAKDAVQYNLDVFIMIDDNNLNLTSINTSSHLRLLQIPNDQCRQYGYQKTTHVEDAPTDIRAWDKAFFYFAVLSKNYSFVWLIEDDVFIPTTRAFLSFHDLYSNSSDLIITSNELNLLGDQSYWRWHLPVGKMIIPWSSSMQNVIGLSRRMLIATDDYVRWHGTIPFHEFFFNTLAIQLNVTIRTPPELRTIVYRTTYSYEQVFKQPNNFWHPVKDPSIRNTWRERFVDLSLMYIARLPGNC